MEEDWADFEKMDEGRMWHSKGVEGEENSMSDDGADDMTEAERAEAAANAMAEANMNETDRYPLYGI